MTWADDPESNYKKQVPANTYEAQNMPNTDNSSDQYYANQSNAEQQQQQQPQQIQQHDYETADDDGTAAGANETPHYQYDNSNQYDNGQYQYHTQPDAVGTNDGYYYGAEQMNQYDQYVAQPEAQPQQQEVNNSLSSVLLAYKCKAIRFSIKYNFVIALMKIWSKSKCLRSAFAV